MEAELAAELDREAQLRDGQQEGDDLMDEAGNQALVSTQSEVLRGAAEGGSDAPR